ncbi:MAG: ribosomal-processing cysteine protease Prp [Fusobacterium sp.]|uniref:ribosomal-processing cysteine protease Prp n=1 Tax=Fusobacterium sp. TaxID=68766 RepID=UPI0026DAD9B5|nr:ribosomal-processing cysteine protease Prp [Fusobacterium sp.]MDO4691071.1 ribosomal-processing cysteine protease Prp [Fusobacterium sp.]
MTVIKIFRRNNNIVGYIAKGHTDYSEQGSDIVCAAVSTALQFPILSMREILKIEPKIIIDEDGFLEVDLRNLDKNNFKKINLSLETMVLFINDLSKQYPKNIKLVEKEDK